MGLALFEYLPWFLGVCTLGIMLGFLYDISHSPLVELTSEARLKYKSDSKKIFMGLGVLFVFVLLSVVYEI